MRRNAKANLAAIKAFGIDLERDFNDATKAEVNFHTSKCESVDHMKTCMASSWTVERPLFHIDESLLPY